MSTRVGGSTVTKHQTPLVSTRAGRRFLLCGEVGRGIGGALRLK